VESTNARDDGEKMCGPPPKRLLGAIPLSRTRQPAEARILELILLDSAAAFPSLHRRVTALPHDGRRAKKGIAEGQSVVRDCREGLAR
jgi:hypothetical protein